MAVKPNRPMAWGITRRQRIADTFYDLELIPKSVQVLDVIWRPS